MAASAVVTQGH